MGLFWLCSSVSIDGGRLRRARAWARLLDRTICYRGRNYLQEMRDKVLTNDRKAVYYIKRYIVR